MRWYCRSAIALLAALGAVCSASATLTVTKAGAAAPTSVATSNCPGTGLSGCWSLTVTSTTSGAGLIIVILETNTTETINGCADGGDTFTMISNFRGSDSNGGGTDACWVAAVTGSKTTVFAGSANGSATPTSMSAYQVVYTNSPLSLDSSGNADRTSASTSIAGISPTITGSSEVVIQGIACGSNCSAINQSYTGDFTGNDGTAFKVTTSTTAPTWTQSPSSTGAVAYASFFEAGGTTAPTKTPTVIE